MDINDLLKIEKTNSSSEFLHDLIKGNFSSCYNFYINLFDEIAKNLQEINLNSKLENFNFSNYEKISKILFYLKGTKINLFPK
jgi:hypothetical protein